MTQQHDRPAILYFGNDWFAENRTSSHQIARCLAKDYRVIYVECPGLRRAKAYGPRPRQDLEEGQELLQGSARDVPEGLKVRTLLQIPLHRFALVRWLNRWLILATLRALMWRERIHRPILWFMVPHLADIAGRLGEQLSVYYCIDDYASLPGVDPGAMRAMDEELTRRADVVFVASATLLEAKKRLNLRTHVSPHGVELRHWRQALDPALPCPVDVADLRHPVIGFFGLIEGLDRPGPRGLSCSGAAAVDLRYDRPGRRAARSGAEKAPTCTFSGNVLTSSCPPTEKSSTSPLFPID